MRCRPRDCGSPERKPGIGLARVSAALTLSLWSALDALLEVIATPIVRAKWQHLLEDRVSGRPVDALAGGGEDPSTDVSGRMEVVCYEDEDPALLKFPAHLLSDHKLDDRSDHGAA